MENLDKLKRQLNVIFGALFMGQTAFAAVAYFVIKPEITNDPENKIPGYVAISLFVAAVVLTRVIGNARLPKIKEIEDEKRKLQAYTALCIIRYAMVEGPVLVSIVFYITSGYDLLLYLTGAGLLYFLSLFPRTNIVDSELGIIR